MCVLAGWSRTSITGDHGVSSGFNEFNEHIWEAGTFLVAQGIFPFGKYISCANIAHCNQTSRLPKVTHVGKSRGTFVPNLSAENTGFYFYALYFASSCPFNSEIRSSSDSLSSELTP